MNKIKYTIITTALVISAFLFGRFSNRDLIDMNQVADIQADAEGVQIVLLDGSGYFWER